MLIEPTTFRSPPTVRLLVIDTSSGSPIVTAAVSEPEPDTVISFAVPAIVAGVYVARPPVTNFAGINLSLANAAHPLQNCRLYYSQIQMEPQHAITYNNSNTNKKVIYRTFVTNNYPATALAFVYMKKK